MVLFHNSPATENFKRIPPPQKMGFGGGIVEKVLTKNKSTNGAKADYGTINLVHYGVSSAKHNRHDHDRRERQ